MKWIGITGTWNTHDARVEGDVCTAVREIIERGDGVVTGGALGVDFWATDEAFTSDPTGKRVLVCLASTLSKYSAHLRTRASEGVVAQDDVEALISLLTKIQETRPSSILEDTTEPELTKETYFARNQTIVDNADEILGFQVNESSGTQDTLDKAERVGKPVSVKKYVL